MRMRSSSVSGLARSSIVHTSSVPCWPSRVRIQLLAAEGEPGGRQRDEDQPQVDEHSEREMVWRFAQRHLPGSRDKSSGHIVANAWQNTEQREDDPGRCANAYRREW